MSKKLYLSLQILVFVATIAYSALMASKLPTVVPTHWNVRGQPDQFGSAAIDLWLMPGIELFLIVLTLALPVLSPKKYEVARFAATFAYIMFLVSVMDGVLHVVIVRAAAGVQFNMIGVIFAVMFLFFMGIGNVMGKVKQNFFVGVRTPWTLAEPAVWDRTHREAGLLWLVGGLIGAILAIVGVDAGVLIAYMLVMAFVPVIRSYMWYRKLVPGGGKK